MSHVDTTRASSLSDSSARGLRTGYQAFVGLLGLVPTLIACFAVIPQDTPGYAQLVVIMANVVVWTGIASKILNVLEDSGVIPAPWKQETKRRPIVAASEKEVNHG